MGKHAWVLKIRPGYEDEYVRRHDEIWPEMSDALTRAGYRNYSIFRYGLTLFGYFECDDLEATITAIKEDPVDARWSVYMAPIMEVEIDPSTGFHHLLTRVFHHA